MCNFDLFLSKFGCHRNYLCSLENSDSILEFADPENPTGKISRFLAQNWNHCNFGWFLPKFGCRGNSLCSLENSDSIFEFADPEDPTIHEKDFSVFYTQLRFCAILADFLPKFDCHSNSLGSLKISDTIFEFADPENPTIHANSLQILYRTKICAILAFFINFVAVATPFAPLKIQMAYLNLPTRKPFYSCEKFPDFLLRIEICAILAYFCLNLVSMATLLAPLKI